MAITVSKDSNKLSKAEARLRFEATLRGAFAGPPTPLKDIPKKTGESRAKRKRASGTKSA